MKRLTPALLWLALAASIAYAQDPPLPLPEKSAPKPAPAKSAEPSAEVQATAAGSNAFAFELYRELIKSKDNLLFSPYSISSALGMTYAGAQGKTKKQMQAVLHLGDDATVHRGFGELNRALITPRLRCGPPNPLAGLAGALGDEAAAALQAGAKSEPGGCASLPASAKNAGPGQLLRIANRIWPQSGFDFKPSFQQIVQKNYGAGLQELDFKGDPDGSKDAINAWVADQTRNRAGDPMIPELLSSLSSDTRMVLTNAIYFQGDWETAFDAKDTRDGVFWRHDGSMATVPMMHRSQGTLNLAYQDGVRLAELPYRGGESSLIVLLPQENTPASLGALEASLTPEWIESLLAKTHASEDELYFPKFAVESEVELKEALETLGMRNLFDPGKANLKGMAAAVSSSGEEHNLLHVSKVVHKAAAAFDEQGAEAAAATAVVAVVESASFGFMVDRPFVYLIRDTKTGTILFLGRVLDPSSE